MNVGTKRQATRLLALAAATPVMVVMATGSAGAAPTVKHKLQGVAQTDVVQVSVNVPLVVTRSRGAHEAVSGAKSSS